MIVRHGRDSATWSTGRPTLLTVLAVVLLAGFFAIAAPARALDDTTPPEITAYSLTPSVIDTESAEQTVTLTVALTDGQSGVSTPLDGPRHVAADLMPMGGGTQQVPISLFRISGDDHDGVYTGSFLLPAGAKSGVWRIEYLTLVDKVGNSVTFDAAGLEALFGAGCAHVTNLAVHSDSTSPQVTAFTLTPPEVDTESAAQTVTVTMTLTDDQAGVSSVGDTSHLAPPSEMTFQPTSGNGQGMLASLTRISGDDRNGVYTGSFTLLAGSQQGTWRVVLNLRDKLENLSFISAADLAAKFGAGCAEVNNLAVHADTTPPQITALDMTPSEFNTESADQTVTVTMALTDDQSGVRLQEDSSYPYVMMSLKPLVGTQEASIYLRRVSGDDRDGIYSGSVKLGAGSKEGIWTVNYLMLVDKLGNLAWLTTADLQALLPAADGLTLVNTATAQQVTVDTDWTIATAHTSVTFPAGTVVTRADDGRFAFYQMAAQEFTLDDSIPTTDLDGTPLATLKLGIPGLNLSFSRPVAVSMVVASAYDGYRLSIQSLTEGGTAWANEASSTVADGRVRFTVNHATRFVANLTGSSAPRPSITKLTPTKARRGATVTVIGKGFGKKRNKSVVKFGARTCVKYVSWSATRIKCKVPATARFGRLQVKVMTAAGTSSGRNFTVKR